MAEDFIDFDSETFNPNSPNYLPPQFMESFLKNDLGPFEIPDLMPKNDIPEHADPRPLDALSNDSNSSTNYSNKHSPESIDYTDNQSGIDRRSEEEMIKPPRNCPVIRKGIQKQYEPFVDNNSLYAYDENSQEYKKARKRLQNRESATRVRNKKKQYVEELESEMAEVKKENADLRVQNASLRAENSLLKQQTCFLEKMVMNRPQYHAISNAPNTYHDRDFHECLLPLVSKAEENASSKSHGYFRAAPPHTFKKHTAMLGVFTLLLCTYGLMSQGSENGDGAIYPGSVGEFKNSFGIGPRNVNEGGAVYGGGNQADLDLSLEALIKANQEYNSIKWVVKTMVIVGYVGYFIYVLLITNWRYVFRIKNKKTL